MSINISVKVYGEKIAKNALKSYFNAQKKALLGVVAKISDDIKYDAINEAPEDLGELKAGIQNSIIEKPKLITGNVLSSASYSAYVEFGTAPHTPPYSALEGWASRHGIPTGAVVRKIAREGTPAQPFMLPAAQQNKNNFINSVQTTLRST